MTSSERSARPRARVDGLIIKELPDEMLVYDLASHKAHCLNSSAAAIWKQFDGVTMISEVAARATIETGQAIDDEVVLLALQQLRKAKLILRDGETNKANKNEGHLSRRDLIKRLGLAATAVPLVTSILAPTAYAAISCGSETCLGTADCPDGCACVGNVCVPI